MGAWGGSLCRPILAICSSQDEVGLVGVCGDWVVLSVKQAGHSNKAASESTETMQRGSGGSLPGVVLGAAAGSASSGAGPSWWGSKLQLLSAWYLLAELSVSGGCIRHTMLIASACMV